MQIVTAPSDVNSGGDKPSGKLAWIQSKMQIMFAHKVSEFNYMLFVGNFGDNYRLYAALINDIRSYT